MFIYKTDFKRYTLIFVLIFLLTGRSLLAQDSVNSSANIYDQTRDDFMIVAYAGAGGAVLGLSTLSFVDKPSDHLKNIVSGAAIGIIAGVLYVVYRQATDAKEMVSQSYDESSAMFESKDYRTSQRMNLLADLNQKKLNLPVYSLSFNF